MLTRFGHPLRACFAMITALLMAVSSLVVPGIASAQDQTVQSQLTGVTISYGSQYTLQPDGMYEPNTLEYMMFVGPADVLAVGFMSPLLDINGARDIMLEGMVGSGFEAATIDRGEYTGVAYSLDIVNIDGLEMGVFTLFMNQRAHGFSEFYIFMAPPSLFATTMQNAQNSFTIDGNPLMDGVDANVMGDMVVANEGVTGGTSATNVEEVTEQTDTTDTTETDTTTGQSSTSGADREDYLAAVSEEYNLVNQSFADFLLTTKDLGDEVITPDEAAPILNSSMETMAGSSQRAAAIQPPADMQEFHQEFLNWSAVMSGVGTSWSDFVNGTSTADDHWETMQNAIPVNEDFGNLLDTEMASTGSTTTGSETADSTDDRDNDTETSRTTRTTRTTATEEATEDSGTSRTTRTTRTTATEEADEDTGTTRTTRTTRSGGNTSETGGSTGTSSDSGDVDTYLEAVRTEYDHVNEQIDIIDEALAGLGDESIPPEEALAMITDANSELASAETRIQDLEAPAGMEDFHDEFLDWNASVVATGDAWVDFERGTIDAGGYIDAFLLLIEDTDAFGQLLADEEQGADSQFPGTRLVADTRMLLVA